ncbi:DNA-binding protein [Escherichia coli]|nr:DNA-binding protein [Escherichia coli]
MNTAIFNGKASMTSVEIAELVGSRPDSVKRTIETLAKKGIIQFPQTVEVGAVTY